MPRAFVSNERTNGLEKAFFIRCDDNFEIDRYLCGGALQEREIMLTSLKQVYFLLARKPKKESAARITAAPRLRNAREHARLLSSSFFVAEHSDLNSLAGRQYRENAEPISFTK